MRLMTLVATGRSRRDRPTPSPYHAHFPSETPVQEQRAEEQRGVEEEDGAEGRWGRKVEKVRSRVGNGEIRKGKKVKERKEKIKK